MFQERIHLNNGTFIPLLGLGTFHLSPPNTHRAVAHAIQIGYRHIDTAAYYGNETEVGQAISESGIPREEIFVTTKLWNDDHDDPRGAFEASLQRLGLDYVDLYLIHWPVEQRIASWKALEKLDRSVCRAIGVSNFTIAHLSELLAAARNVPIRWNSAPSSTRKSCSSSASPKASCWKGIVRSPVEENSMIRGCNVWPKNTAKPPPRSLSAGRCNITSSPSPNPRIPNASRKTPIWISPFLKRTCRKWTDGTRISM